MRSALADAILPAVAEQVRIAVDLELTQPVSGSLSTDGGEAIRFSGWLDLHSALEATCEAARARNEESERLDQSERRLLGGQ